jgi:Icc-related predicted phosphoesterase
MKFNLTEYINPNEMNILVHSGDCTNIGKENEVKDFVNYMKAINGFDFKIFIAGNHDFAFQNKPVWYDDIININDLLDSKVIYLQDSEINLFVPEFGRNIKIYGSPWQPWFYNWAFNLHKNSDELNAKWDMIPNDTDVLITHGPPFGFNDKTVSNESVGCELLRKKILQIKPILSVFGHIHNGYGTTLNGDTLYVNASVCNEQYNPINKPIIVELKEINGKILAYSI